MDHQISAGEAIEILKIDIDGNKFSPEKRKEFEAAIVTSAVTQGLGKNLTEVLHVATHAAETYPDQVTPELKAVLDYIAPKIQEIMDDGRLKNLFTTSTKLILEEIQTATALQERGDQKLN